MKLFPWCILFSILLIIKSSSTYAQNYRNKPYLEIEDSISKKIYRLKIKNVFIKTNLDSTIKKDRIIAYQSDSILITERHEHLNINNIQEIRFRPNNAKRVFKQIGYTASALTELSLVFTGVFINNSSRDQFLLLGSAFLLLPVFYVSTEVGGVIVQSLTPPVRLSKFRITIVE
jgi:hypothetical protein